MTVNMMLANTFFNGSKNLSKSSLEKMWTRVSVLSLTKKSSNRMSSTMMSSTQPLTVVSIMEKSAMLPTTMLSWTTSTCVPTTSMPWTLMSLKSFHTLPYLNQRERDDECVLCRMERMHADLMKDGRSWAVVADTNGNAFNLVIDPSTNIQPKMKTRPAAVGYAETEMGARPEAAAEAEANSEATLTMEEMKAEADDFFQDIFSDYGDGVAKNWDSWTIYTEKEKARNRYLDKRMNHEKRKVERRDANFAGALFEQKREVDKQKNISANKSCDNDSGNNNNLRKFSALSDRKNHNDNNKMIMDENNNSHEKMGPGLWDGKFYPNYGGSQGGPSAASSSAPSARPSSRSPHSTALPPPPSPPRRVSNSGFVNNKENVVVVGGDKIKSRSLDWSLYLMLCGLACGGAAAGYQLYLQSTETKKKRGTSGSGKKT